MQIKIKDKISPIYTLQIGDVVCFDNNIDTIKMVMYDTSQEKYILRGICTTFGATGYHKTLEELTESISHLKCDIYKASEYELILQRKEG